MCPGFESLIRHHFPEIYSTVPPARGWIDPTGVLRILAVTMVSPGRRR
jgi:hypothetical protein